MQREGRFAAVLVPRDEAVGQQCQKKIDMAKNGCESLNVSGMQEIVPK